MSPEVMEDKILTHDERLNNHGARLDKIEQDNVKLTTEIKNLCTSLNSLTNLLRLFLGACGTAMLGFIFWYIQQLGT